MHIAIVDYGMGNLRSVSQALQHVDHATDRTGGLALRVVAISAQIGHGMKGAVEVTRAVDQQ